AGGRCGSRGGGVRRVVLLWAAALVLLGADVAFAALVQDVPASGHKELGTGSSLFPTRTQRPPSGRPSCSSMLPRANWASRVNRAFAFPCFTRQASTPSCSRARVERSSRSAVRSES